MITITRRNALLAGSTAFLLPSCRARAGGLADAAR